MGPILQQEADLFSNFQNALKTNNKVKKIEALDYSKVIQKLHKNTPKSFIESYFKNKIDLVKLEIERNKQIASLKQPNYENHQPAPIRLKAFDATSPCVVATALHYV